MHPVVLLLTALALIGLLAGCELAGRLGLAPGTTRRLAHVVGAGTAALFPLYLGLLDVLALAAFFTVLLAWTQAHRALGSIHGVGRSTVGAVALPLGIGLAALAVWRHPAAFAFGALVLAVADPAAAITGERFDGPAWRVAGGRKSLAGSLAFFVATFVLSGAFAAVWGQARLLGVVGVSTLLTIVEAGCGYGLDNLAIPLVASVLGALWLLD